MREQRSAEGPFDVVAGGELPGEDAEARAERRRRSREVGASWWLEWIGVGEPFAATLRRVRGGPPRD